MQESALKKNFINHFSDYTEKLTIGLSILCMFTLSIVMIVSVIFRYWLKIPIYWSNEMSLVLFGWVSFLGGCLGVKKSTMLAVTFLKDKLAVRWRLFVNIIIQLLILIFSVTFLYLGIKWVSSPGIIDRPLATIPVPKWIPYSVLPLSMAFATIFSFDNLIRLIANFRAGKDEIIC